MQASRIRAAGGRRLRRLAVALGATPALLLFLAVGSAHAAGPLGLGVLDPLTDPLTEITDPVVDVIEPAIEPVVDVIDPILEPVNDAIVPIVEPVADVLEPVTDVIAPVTELVDPIVEPVGEIVETVVEPVAEVVETVVEPITPVVESVTTVVRPVATTVEAIVSPVGQTVSSVLRPIIPPAAAVLDPIVEPLLPPSPDSIPQAPILDPDPGVIDGPATGPEPATGHIDGREQATISGTSSHTGPDAAPPTRPDSLVVRPRASTFNPFSGGGSFGLPPISTGALTVFASSLLAVGWLALLLLVNPPPWAGALLRAAPFGWRPQHFVEPLEPPG